MTGLMHAVTIENPGPSARLVLAEVPAPIARNRELLIRVAYAGVNRADLFQLQGSYPPPQGAPPYPGLEVSGHVEALGGEVNGWKVGDPVCALLEGGGYAEYVAVPASQAMPVPHGVSLREAAGLPEVFATVWQTVMDQAKLRAGETFLVHGGASGIGTAAIQLAKVIAGARVYATAGTDEKCAYSKQLGATEAFNYRQQDFSERLKDSVDVILDMTGGDNVSRNFRALKKGGHLVSIAFLRGAKAEVAMGPLLSKHLTWTGSTLRSRTREEKAAICRHLVETVWPEIVAGRIRTVIDGEFSLGEAQNALKRMQEGLNLGKIVLKVANSS